MCVCVCVCVCVLGRGLFLGKGNDEVNDVYRGETHSNCAI